MTVIPGMRVQGDPSSHPTRRRNDQCISCAQLLNTMIFVGVVRKMSELWTHTILYRWYGKFHVADDTAHPFCIWKSNLFRDFWIAVVHYPWMLYPGGLKSRSNLQRNTGPNVIEFMKIYWKVTKRSKLVFLVEERHRHAWWNIWTSSRDILTVYSSVYVLGNHEYSYNEAQAVRP